MRTYARIKLPAALDMGNAVDTDPAFVPSTALACTSPIPLPPLVMLLIVMLSGFVFESELASVTCTVKLLVPATVEVPEIAPVPELSDSPLGRVPAEMDQVYGVVPAVAAKVAL
jgi:hypothetical protein